MQGMRSNISFPNGIRAKSLKYKGPGCSKKTIWRLVILLFILLVLLFQCNYHLQVDDFCVHVTCFILICHSSLLLFSHQAVWKPLKFINVLQTNESFLNKSKFLSLLSLCTFILGHYLGKCSSNFCTNINIKVY